MSLRRQKKRVLITLGPTRAYLDSVRYLSNYSTGELGVEIIRALLKEGFEVAAVVGPVHFDMKNKSLKKVEHVITVDQMRSSTLKLCQSFKPDYFLPAAAVLDFVPRKTQTGKTSSTNKIWKLELVPTKKIIDEVQKKFPGIKRFGFKLEVGNFTPARIKAHALQIMKKKELEGLCLNFLNEISGKKHPAYIFSNDTGNSKKATTKKQIAALIVKTIKGWDENATPTHRPQI